MTNKQLLAAAGLRSVATMQRWIKKGILLPGQGPEALARCEWFRKQREQGLSEPEMKEALTTTTRSSTPQPRPNRRAKEANDEVTTAQVLEAAGLKSRAALYKWIKRGILLGPVEKRGAGPGRGVHLRWSQEALRQALWFRSMRQRGHRVRQLEKILNLAANTP